MNNLSISIFKNKIFSEIIRELKLFSEFNVKFYDDLNLCMKDATINNSLVVLFVSEENTSSYTHLLQKNIPIIFLTKNQVSKETYADKMIEKISMPFTIINFKKKVISLFARHEFKKRSLINLSGYIIDKNERKIKRNNLELQLTEKEINFLILFSQNKNPINKDFVLKKVWKYSTKTETHTVETHIHRLRKKILYKFNDNNFIKNNNKGYYI